MTTTPPPTSKRLFTIAVTDAETFKQSFEAASEQEAIAMATEDWEQNGATNWHFVDNELSDFLVLDESPAEERPAA